MRIHVLLFTCLVLSVSPAFAAWRATTPSAQEAVKSPRIAAALNAAVEFDKALLSKDVATFEAMFTDSAVVNNPFNKIARKSDAINNMRTGLIDYTSLERMVEYAATRGEHEVLIMGEEALTPVGRAKFAGKNVRRRTTEIWTDVSGKWQLSVRQATIYAVE